MRRLSLTILVLASQISTSAGGPRQAKPSDLMDSAEAIVVAQVSETDYTRTPADGPMTARAKVLAVVKGRLRNEQSFVFTETAWVGPDYRKGEVRILFLESAGSNSWRILSSLHAKSNFLIESDAIPILNARSLKLMLETFPVSLPDRILITKAMLR